MIYSPICVAALTILLLACFSIENIEENTSSDGMQMEECVETIDPESVFQVQTIDSTSD